MYLFGEGFGSLTAAIPCTLTRRKLTYCSLFLVPSCKRDSFFRLQQCFAPQFSRDSSFFCRKKGEEGAVGTACTGLRLRCQLSSRDPSALLSVPGTWLLLFLKLHF